MDQSEEFGSWGVVHHRLRKWSTHGIREKVFTAPLAQDDAQAISTGSSQVTPPASARSRLASDGRRPLACHVTPGRAGGAPVFTLVKPPSVGDPSSQKRRNRGA